jgi:hypothetical protein
MDTPTRCPACGADWTDGQTCTDHFHLMSAWELDNQLYDVHHLMVLCYHLQHPGLYSPEGLTLAKKLLMEFLEDGIEPQGMRRHIGKTFDSGKRDYRIKGTPDSRGTYEHPVRWEMVAADVTRAGIDHYYASVRRWAESILKSLRETGNLDEPAMG